MQQNSSRGANPSSQPALPAEQAESGENFYGAPAQQEASPTPGVTPPSTTKKGLLSSWTPGNQAVQQNGVYNNQPFNQSMSQANGNSFNGNVPTNFNGNQVSPHPSSAGMTPFAAFQGPQNGQQQPPFNGQRPQNGQAMQQQGPMGGPQQQRPRQTSPLNPSMANMQQQPMGMPGQQSMHGNMQQQPLNRVAGPPSQPFGMPNQQSMHGNMQQPMGNPNSPYNGSGQYNNSGNFNNAVGVMAPRQTGPLNNRNAPGSFGNPPGQGKPPFKSGKPKRRFPIWTRVLLGVFVVLLVISGGLYWYYQQNYADFVAKSTGQAATKHHVIDNGHTNSALTASSDTLTGGRINILLLGSDTDGKNGNNVTPLAQTDIVVTIDPQTHYVGMLSIPRDLQVTQSDTAAHYKLDEVFSHGGYTNDLTSTVRNSAGLSIQTIEYNFGIHINYYAWVGLSGFVKVIDTAGGVDIDAIHPMVDDNYPFDVGNKGSNTDYERLYIPPGPQHMNGIQALTYVRTRHSDLVGDFGRSVRQQQILSQLKTKLATPGIVNELPQLINDLKGDVITDMPVAKMIELANYARGLDPNKIDRVTLSPPTYSYASTQKNSSNFYPNCYAIQQKITQMFNLGNTANCIPQAGYNEGSVGYTPSPNSAGTAIANTATSTNTNGYMSANSSMSMLAQTNELSLSQPSQTETIHSILDLVFAVTFESPEGLQV